MIQTIATIAADHVDLVSAKSFEDTARDLAAQLGRPSAWELMGLLDWGGVLNLSGVAMKALCFLIGDPVTARALLAAGGPAVGLYLPVKMLVYEAGDGTVHVAYDQLPLMAPSEDDALSVVAAGVDAALKEVACGAAGWG